MKDNNYFVYVYTFYNFNINSIIFYFNIIILINFLNIMIKRWACICFNKKVNHTFSVN